MIPLVSQLATTWSSIADLCAELSEEEWKRPTGCPGWSVQDQLSHLIDFEAFALGRPRPDHSVGDLSNARNDMGKMNEIGVDFRRPRSGAEVLAEFEEVTAARLERLAALTEEKLDEETTTPIGPGTVRDLLTLRNMDTWSHEQDIRRALGRPGHTSGPEVDDAIAYWAQFLPYAVGKLAGAPEGTTAVFLIGEHRPVAVEVVDGRGRAATEIPDSPTVRLRMDSGAFAALVGARTDARPDDVEVTGDQELGRTIAAHLGFLP